MLVETVKRQERFYAAMLTKIFIPALLAIVTLAFGTPAVGATQSSSTSTVVATTSAIAMDGDDPAEWTSPPEDILVGDDAEDAPTILADTCYGAGCNDKGPVATGCSTSGVSTARSGTFQYVEGTYKLELRYSSFCNAFWVRASGGCESYVLKIRNSPTASTSDIRMSLSQEYYGEPEWSNMVSGAGRWVQANVGCRDFYFGDVTWSGWSGWSYGA